MNTCHAPVNEMYHGKYVTCQLNLGHRGEHEYVPLKAQGIIVSKKITEAEEIANELWKQSAAAQKNLNTLFGTVQVTCSECSKLYKLKDLILETYVSSEQCHFVCPKGHINPISDRPEIDNYVVGFGTVNYNFEDEGTFIQIKESL